MAARISSNTGRFDIADAAAVELLSSESSNPAGTSPARIGLGLIAVQRSDMTAAAEQLSALESLRGTMSGGFSVGAMSIDRLLGLLSHTMGNLDEARGYFEESLKFCRKAGFGPELAWTCCDYADTLLQHHSSTGSEQTGDNFRGVGTSPENEG